MEVLWKIKHTLQALYKCKIYLLVTLLTYFRNVPFVLLKEIFFFLRQKNMEPQLQQVQRLYVLFLHLKT